MGSSMSGRWRRPRPACPRALERAPARATAEAAARVAAGTAAEMRIPRRIGIAVVAAALAAGAGAGHAGDPPQQSAEPPVDQGLLEFLGSVDPSSDSTAPDDGSWLTWLSQVNIGKGAKTSRPPQAPAQQKPGSAAGTEKPSG